MKPTSTQGEDVASADRRDRLTAERIQAGELTVASRRAHAASGVTTSLILAYLERELGRAGVDRVLALSGLTDQESRMRDESSWFAPTQRSRCGLPSRR